MVKGFTPSRLFSDFLINTSVAYFEKESHRRISTPVLNMEIEIDVGFLIIHFMFICRKANDK